MKLIPVLESRVAIVEVQTKKSGFIRERLVLIACNGYNALYRDKE